MAVAAAGVCAASVGSITSATVATVYVGSGVSYQMYVEKLGSKQIELHIHFTNSSSINIMEFMLEYDESCELVSVSGYFANNFIHPDGSTKLFFDFISSGTYLTGDFVIDCVFNTSDSADNAHTFTATFLTLSTTGGTGDTIETPSYSITTSDLYTLGDVDNNGSVDLFDAQYVLKIIDAEGTYGILNVSDANSKKAEIQKNICSGFVCGEAADVDLSNQITEADSLAISDYRARYMVGKLTADDIINTKYYQSITA